MCMKVLFIAERFPPDIGGVAASAARIARSLARLGHVVHVATLTRELRSGSVERHDLGEGVPLYRLGQSKNLDFSLQQALVFLQWLHGQERFDLVWGHYAGTAGFLAAWLGRQLGIRSVLAVRGNDLDRALFPPGDLARLDWCLRHATQIVAVSADLAGKVRCLVDRDAAVLPNAVDTDLFHPGPRPIGLAQALGLGGEQTVLGFSGELRAKKGLSFLLEALAAVRQHVPARLLVVGAVRSDDQGELERACVGLGLEGCLHVTGHLDRPAEVARHLLLCDVFLLPSLWDGMPNGLLEAMACGVPVVASDAGGIPEVLRDGVNGVVVPRSHLHQLGRHVLALLDRPADERQALARAARATVVDRHSLPAEQAALAELLAGLPSNSS
jgi:glycosyltransferase involved in cell wall biosynthesis